MWKKYYTQFQKIMEPAHHFRGVYALHFFIALYERISSIFLLQVMALIVASVDAGNVDKLYYNVFLLGGIVLLGFLAHLGLNWTWTKNSYNIRKYLVKKYGEAYIQLDHNRLESFGVGRSSNIIYSGLSAQENLVIDTMCYLIVDILTTIYAFVIIATSVTRTRSIGFFAVFGFGLWLMVISFNKSQVLRKKVKDIEVEIDRRKTKLLMSKFEIFQNNKFPVEYASYLGQLNSALKYERKSHKIKVFRQFGTKTLVEGARIALYLIVGVGVITGQYQIAYLVLLTGLMGEVSNAIYSFRWHLKAYSEGMVHIEKLWDMFSSIPKIQDDTGKPDFVYQGGEISIKNLLYGYGQKKPVFSKLSLDIQGGKKTALVGPSGSGKSTLLKLLAGYLHPEGGKIYVDGQNIMDVKLKAYYQHIGYLTQEPSVFDGTIYENLVYGMDLSVIARNDNDEVISGITEIASLRSQGQNLDKELEKVIKLAKCEFIREFEKGLETEIGERGIKLSGGQKQRLAIAKIMLKNPQIILLDEPTSALDSISEQGVAEALHNLFVGRTVVVVAHRLQTVKEADEILVIDHGKIKERGTHAQLKKQGGIYSQMLDLQTTF